MAAMMSNFELYWGGISQGKFAIRAKFFITVDKKWTSFLWPSSLKYNYIAILTITEVDKGQAHADGRIFHCSQIRFDIKLEAKRRILCSKRPLTLFSGSSAILEWQIAGKPLMRLTAGASITWQNIFFSNFQNIFSRFDDNSWIFRLR